MQIRRHYACTYNNYLEVRTRYILYRYTSITAANDTNAVVTMIITRNDAVKLIKQADYRRRKNNVIITIIWIIKLNT